MPPVGSRLPEGAEPLDRLQLALRKHGPNALRQCCPRPPLSPRQTEETVRILVDSAQRQHREALDLERRWKESVGTVAR